MIGRSMSEHDKNLSSANKSENKDTNKNPSKVIALKISNYAIFFILC